MSELLSPRSIRSPGELRAILEALREAVRDRVLDESSVGRSELAPDITISDVPLDGPWPDFFELRFREPTTGKRYKLEVETFHGAGGDWAEVV